MAGDRRRIINGFSLWTQTMDWLRLVKLPISLMNAVAVVAGYALCRPFVEPALILAAVSVLILACGSAALNNYQDRKIDGFFPRTRERPLPRQAIRPGLALLFSLLLIFCGMIGLLCVNSNAYSAGLGLLAVILYNGMYTPLKYRTILAVIPGSLCGMLPPFIGWMAAGGDIHAPQLIVLMVILGVWQLPHFWLILLSDSTSYRTGQIPNMLHMFSVHQLHRLLFIWVLAFASMAMFLPVIQVVTNPWLGGLLVICLLITIWFVRDILRRQKRTRRTYSFYFNWLNSSMGTILLAIILDRMF